MSEIMKTKEKNIIVAYTIIDGENEYGDSFLMESSNTNHLEEAYQELAEIYGIDEEDKKSIIQSLNNEEMAQIDCRGLDSVYIKEPETVKVFVRGGVIQDIQNIPPAIHIQVQDYDVEGTDNPDQDSEGIPCNISIWQ